MAAKKRTKKAAGKKTRSAKKTSPKKGKRKSAKKAGKRGKSSKKRAKKTRQSYSLPQAGSTAYGWMRIPPKIRSQFTSKWKRTKAAKDKSAAASRLAASTAATTKLLGSGGPGVFGAMAKAYGGAEKVPGEMKGAYTSGPWVGPQKPWPKKAKAAKKAAKRAVVAVKKAVAAEKTASKAVRAATKASGKTAKRKAKKAVKAVAAAAKAEKAAVHAVEVAKTTSKKAGKKSSSKKAGRKSNKKRSKRGGRPASSGAAFAQKMAAARAAKAAKRKARKGAAKHGKAKHGRKASKRRRSKKSWPRVGKSKRTFGIPKFKAMNALGVPPNHPVARGKRKMLRESAGRGITAKQVFDMSRSTQMKAWVCAGKVRTGCGGGSSMLRGSHQIGVFGVGRR